MMDYDVFYKELECIYGDEKYSVRDNGKVFRHPRNAKRPRPTDNQWTFGKPNCKTDYLEIASVRIHRIVATAFHGEHPTKEHVVDHIDTNRWNNRPENLRWVTRLENVLLNPITAKRIALICGSVEDFLANPLKFRDKFQDSNFKWMQTVSPKEAQISKERLLNWAESDKRPSGGSLGKWVFERPKHYTKKLLSKDPELTMAKTNGAAQRNWFTPCEFPCCPKEIGDEPIVDYAEKLKIG